MCLSLRCPNNCNGNGACVGGKCQCHLGWTGWSCEHSVCGANGGDDVCFHLHGTNTFCNQSTGLCQCVRGSDCDLASHLSKASDPAIPATPATPSPASMPTPATSSWAPVQLETREPVQPPAAMPAPPAAQPPAQQPEIPDDISLGSGCSPGRACRSVAIVGAAYSADGFQQVSLLDLLPPPLYFQLALIRHNIQRPSLSVKILSLHGPSRSLAALHAWHLILCLRCVIYLCWPIIATRLTCFRAFPGLHGVH